jgi:hypothetical protein
MTIGASHRAALHFFMTAHALTMICTFEPQIRFPLFSVIVVDDYRLMALTASGGRSLWAMVVAFRAIASNVGMLAM